MMKEDALDNALVVVGFGRWQIPYIVTFILVMMVQPLHMIGSTLLNAPIAFRCLYNNHSHGEETFSVETELSLFNNMTIGKNDFSYYDNRCFDSTTHLKFIKSLDSMTEQEFNNSLYSTTPKENNDYRNSTTLKESYDQFINPVHTTGLSSCPQVEYDSQIFVSTIVSQWNLLCERMFFRRPLYQMMFSIGTIVGTLSAGLIRDRFGHTRTIQVSSIACLVTTVCMYFVPWYFVLLVLRFTTGVACTCMTLASYSIAQDIIPSWHQSWTRMVIEASFSIGIIGFAVFGYLLRDWHHLMLASSSVLLVLIPLSFWIDESPRWLLQNGGEKKVSRILEKATEMNRRYLNESMLTVLSKINEKSTQNSNDRPTKSTIRSSHNGFPQGGCFYLHSSTMRTIFLITLFVWMLQNFVFFGIILNTNNFTSNPFTYVAMSGIMDAIGILLAIPLTILLGGRCSMFVGFSCGSCLLLVNLAFPSDLWWVSWSLVMAAFLLIATALQINVVYTFEILPLSMRKRCFVWLYLAGNLGFASASLITEILFQQASWYVTVTLGCAGLLATLLVSPLPETRGTPLPRTDVDVEQRYLEEKLKNRRLKARTKLIDVDKSIIEEELCST